MIGEDLDFEELRDYGDLDELTDDLDLLEDDLDLLEDDLDLL